LRKGISPLLASVLLIVIGISVALFTYSYMFSLSKPVSETVNKQNVTSTNMRINSSLDYNLIYVGYIGSDTLPPACTYVFIDTSNKMTTNHQEIYVHMDETFRVVNGVYYRLTGWHEDANKIFFVHVERVEITK